MERLFKVSVIITAVLCCGFFSRAGYAAEDANSFGQLLNKIRVYDYGKSRADLVKISEEIGKTSGKPEMKGIEKQLDEFLKSDATYAAKDFVCRELSVIGTEASAPALAPMLTDEKYSDMARYALERIPGAAVDKALREALPKAAGNAKMGIINTIGVRGDKEAVGLLSGLVSDANEAVAIAAVASLGRIDDPAATEAIAKAKDKATGALRAQLLDAYLRCADCHVAKGQKDVASAIYKQLYVPAESLPIRVAAVRGMIITAGDKTADTVVEALKSPDKAIQTAGIETLKEVVRQSSPQVAKTDVVKAAAAEMPNLGAEQQMQLLTALADCGDRAVLPTVLTAVKSTDNGVRVAALNAIGVLGDVSTVDLLVQTAATARGAEQKAAQEALYRLRGAGVDEAIIKAIAEAEPKAKVELIRSCEQRNITAAVPALMKAVQDSDGRVRAEAIKALRAVAGAQDLAGLIDLQLAASGADRSELEKTVVAVAGKIPQDKGRAEKVLAALPAAKDVNARCSLLSVLGKIGDPAGLPVLRESLSDKDEKVKEAAVRGLSDWPTAAPAAELLKIAKESENEVQKTLALRGYVRLIGLESDKTAEEVIKMYQEAMTLAPNAAEKRMVLSGLANVSSFEALQMAGGYLDDAELKQEAEAAVVKIAESTIRRHPQETKELLRKVLAGTASETVREEAQKLLKIQ
jgi:HEAT repeat protein